MNIQELKKSKEHFQHLVENAGEIITILSYDGTIQFENPALRRVLGYDPDEVLNDDLLTYVHPDDVEKVKTKLSDIMESVGNKGSFEFRYKHKDGTWRYLDSHVKNIKDPRHGPGLLFLSRDVTERVNYRLQLEHSKKQLTLTQSIAKIGIWEWDLKKDKSTFSGELCNMYGIGEEESPDTLEEAFQLVHPEDRPKIVKKLKSALEKKEKYRLEHRIILPDGMIKNLYGRGDFVKDEQGDYHKMVGTYQDITEIKETEKQLRTYSKQLKNLTNEQERVRENERLRIARDIHDELGQMLTVLKMEISLQIKKSKKELGKKYRFLYSKEITDILNRIDTIIESVQRITLELRPEILIDLGLTEALEWQAGIFQQKSGITMNFHYSDEVSDKLEEDRSIAVFRIFQEISTNIMRHAQASKVEVELKEKDNHLILMVQDNGKGITEKEIEHPESLGIIGMRERSDILGGSLQIKGSPGKGTTVELKIPMNGSQN